MSTHTSPLIEILSSLTTDWEYAPLIRKKLESGDISWEEVTELTDILWSGMQGIDDENSKIAMQNILFRKYLIQTEEVGVRKSENATIDALLAGL